MFIFIKRGSLLLCAYLLVCALCFLDLVTCQGNLVGCFLILTALPCGNRFIRHPAYASFIIMGKGIALGYSSVLGLIAIPVFLIP